MLDEEMEKIKKFVIFNLLNNTVLFDNWVFTLRYVNNQNNDLTDFRSREVDGTTVRLAIDHFVFMINLTDLFVRHTYMENKAHLIFENPTYNKLV